MSLSILLGLLILPATLCAAYVYGMSKFCKNRREEREVLDTWKPPYDVRASGGQMTKFDPHDPWQKCYNGTPSSYDIAQAMIADYKASNEVIPSRNEEKVTHQMPEAFDALIEAEGILFDCPVCNSPCEIIGDAAEVIEGELKLWFILQCIGDHVPYAADAYWLEEYILGH